MCYMCYLYCKLRIFLKRNSQSKKAESGCFLYIYISKKIIYKIKKFLNLLYFETFEKDLKKSKLN